MRIRDSIRLAALGLALVAWPAAAAAESSPYAAAAPSDTPGAKADAAEPQTDPAGSDAEQDKPKPAEPTAEDLFKQGRDALYKGQYDRAIELLGQAVAADSSKTSYRLHLARAYRYAQKDELAAAQLEEILKASPDHVEAGQALGEIYSAAQRWKDVVRVLEPLLKYRHDYPTYHMLAEAQYNLDQPDKARKSYEEAVKLNPQSAVDHYQLGNIYLSDKFFALAADSYQAALRLGRDSPVLRYKLGSAYFNLRNYFGQIAVRTIRSGKAGTINGSWYLIEPGTAAGGRGRQDAFRCAPEASAIYQVAKALAEGIEDRPDIHVLQATIYLNARRYAQAYEMFTKIGPTVLKEDKALFLYYFAQAAFGTGRYDRYLELLKEAIKLDPEAYKATLVDAYSKVADQYNQSGQLDKYTEYLAAAVAESPQTASLHLTLGDAYEEAQQHDQAVAQWQMVLDLEPEHPQRMKLLNLIQKYRGVATPSAGPSTPSRPEEPEKPPADNQ
jgi:tetratricopeptide (TPR) repeat protein